MVKTETPNYKERLSDVDRIVGEPTYTTLRRLEKEIRRNAGSIPSTEGGGELGHTFLVLNDETFQALPGAVAWQRPTHPGTLQIPVNATAAQATAQRDAHEESIRVFNEAIGMEQALKQQIQSAIDPKYLKGITDRTTQRLIPSIPEIMTWLYEQYGHVTPTMFLAEQTRIMNLSYNPSNPISELWDELEDLQDLSIRANHDLPDTLLISFAWSLLNQCGIYAKDLNEWDRLPTEDRTWQNMKTFFNRKHKEYKSVNHGTTMQESSLNHESAYAIVNRVSVLETKLHDIQSALEELLQTIKTSSSNEKRNNRRENPYGTHYCWTHGWVNHKGCDCSNKKPGHQDDATLTNRKGGSTNGVPRILLKHE